MTLTNDDYKKMKDIAVEQIKQAEIALLVNSEILKLCNENSKRKP